jgi:pSer/pThr/pTyr-binding forkhead associated (FHA) protein
MNELTLEWEEANRVKTEIISDQQPSKHLGSVRIGRDLADCDIVLGDRTVSRLHIEIFFDKKQHCFKLRNLKGNNNPPLVNGQQIIHDEVALHQGSIIILGRKIIKVIDISITSVNQVYSLKCPACCRALPYDFLISGCPYDGHSLADAISVLNAKK